MKKRLVFLAPVLFVVFLISGCVSPGGAGGLLFNYYSAPYQATDNQSGPKRGTASVHCVLMLACFGDAGIARASKNGNVSRISTVDYEYLSVLSVIYNRTTIVVTGE